MLKIKNMIEKKEKGRPPLKDRNSIKDQRFQFVFSLNDVSRFGNRKVLIAAVKDFVDNFNLPKTRKK